MHEGYALFIEERRDYNGPFVVPVYSIIIAIGVMEHRNLLHPAISILFINVLSSFLIYCLYYSLRYRRSPL